MTSFEEAFARIGSAARPLAAEGVPIAAATGRALASPVVARIDSPRRDVSAMDGYAVRDEDIARLPARLKVVGESFAGLGWDGRIGPGECVRIFTGAPIPAGASRVVIQENVRREDETAVIESSGNGRNIRSRGGDFRAGDALLPAGRMLDPRAIVAAAAADLSSVQVWRRPRLAILGTGDELADPGSAADDPESIPESVSYGVAALALGWGGEVVSRRRLGDDLEAMEKAAGEALETADLAVVTGGASVGEKDFAKAMFEPLGLDLIFSRLAIKPGKPVWLGRVGDKLILGLPGNPTSAMVTARLLLAPLICALTGRPIADALRWRKAPLAEAVRECGPRETFHRGRWSGESVEILGFQDSSAQKALAEVELLVRQPANSPALDAGEMVQVLDF